MSFDPGLPLARSEVVPQWIDYNGHMNVAYYVLAFDQALDKFCDRIDIGADYVRRTNCSIFVLEMHVTYLQEVVAGDPLAFTLQMLEVDEKRFHYFLRMYHAEQGYLAAASEQIALHVDLATRRSAPFPDTAMRQLEEIAAAHRNLPRPEQAGRRIGLPRKAA